LPVGREGEESLQACAIGGTDGNHNTGAFLDSMRCFSRSSGTWHEPVQRLPLAMDHGNAVLIPAGTCAPSDPQRVLLMNFRTAHYQNQRTEVLAVDLAESTRADSPRPPWYVYSNDTNSLPRDAGGVVLTGGGRIVLNFGGVYYVRTETMREATAFFEGIKANFSGVEVHAPKWRPLPLGSGKYDRRYETRIDFKEIRAFDVCGSRRWFSVDELEFARFAIQSCASSSHTFTCGGFGRDARCEGLRNQNCRSCEVHDTLQLAAIANDTFRKYNEGERLRRLLTGKDETHSTARTVQGQVFARFGF